ncbi:hypothetical protein [Duganella vulcania]|uniref:Uncharacterized protein n=1 Tax=Duganella vulcania TaxID=2692166 RepID=A0A845GG71_9BURK|nr:hypothetical protein [Duganella vulcania]MYM92402.1 hypothetical protein [Duganella vulcania]
MKALESLAPLVGGISIFVALFVLAIPVLERLFDQWREEEKQYRRWWLVEKKRMDDATNGCQCEVIEKSLP